MGIQKREEELGGTGVDSTRQAKPERRKPVHGSQKREGATEGEVEAARAEEQVFEHLEAEA